MVQGPGLGAKHAREIVGEWQEQGAHHPRPHSLDSPSVFPVACLGPTPALARSTVTPSDAKMADAAYLKRTVGPALAQGIAQCAAKQPQDPIQYIAAYLMHDALQDKNSQQIVQDEQKRQQDIQIKRDKNAIQKLIEEKQTKKAQDEEEARTEKFSTQMEGAVSAEDVYQALIALVANQVDGAAQIWVTDLPDTEYKPPPAPLPPADQGAEEYAQPAAETEDLPKEDTEEVSTEEQPQIAKVKPSTLNCIAAEMEDQHFMIGEQLKRVVNDAEGGGDAGAGASDVSVIFNAIDDFLAGGAPTLHIPSAIQHPGINFYRTPRTGAWLVTAIGDVDGNVPAVLAVDLLSRGATFSEEDIQKIESSAALAATRVEELASALGTSAAGASVELLTAYEETRPSFAAELEKAQAAQDSEDGDKAAVAKCRAKRAMDDLAPLTAACPVLMEQFFSRRLPPNGLLPALKASYILIDQKVRPKIPDMNWIDVKRSIRNGQLPGGDSIFTAIAATTVDDEGATAAINLLGDIEEESLKSSCLMAYLLITWVRAAVELFKQNEAIREEAEAAAAAAEAEAAAAAAAAEAATEAQSDDASGDAPTGLVEE